MIRITLSNNQLLNVCNVQKIIIFKITNVLEEQRCFRIAWNTQLMQTHVHLVRMVTMLVLMVKVVLVILME